MFRTISSNMTIFYKLIFPILWIGGFGVGAVGLFSSVFAGSQGKAVPDAIKWQFLAILVLGSAFIYWACVRLKRVTLRDGNLLISNFRTTVVVPIADIERVTENRWINIHPVTLHFFRETEFGKQVVFMPKIRFCGFLSSHPVVQELREAAARSSEHNPGPAA
jgi:hypothetical protein